MIVEMAGRPAEHLTESLEKHVGILRQVKDVSVHEIKVSEPRLLAQGGGQEVEGNKEKVGEDMFTAFAECDFEIPSFSRLAETMFDFMPSSVEVIEPGRVELDMTEATDLLNNISGRMHRYDEFAKVAGERMKQLVSQIQKMQKILISRDEEIAGLKGGKIKILDKESSVEDNGSIPSEKKTKKAKAKKASKKKK